MPAERGRDLLRRETSAEEYERLYSSDEGADRRYGAYDRHYLESHYYPLYTAVFDELLRLGARDVLEVGCGSGSFAHLLMDRSRLAYHGFDFSEAAIRKAVARTGAADAFSVGRAGENTLMQRHYDTIVCLEVLEHIEKDLEVVESWRSGCICTCSVPNFDQPDHVRYFRHEEEIRERYGSLIEIERVLRIPRALVRGRGWMEYLRQLRWSRDNPARFLAMLGYRTFENLAGWFVFSGRRSDSP